MAPDPLSDHAVRQDVARRLNGMALLVEYLRKGGASDDAEAVRLLDAIIEGADGVDEVLAGNEV